ncbi:MAG: hypothetical protein E7413_02655 [Ruminococcaceae bacterium]|nr:hypothetical protein [Oscillospiraceae bacterium]
MKLTDRQGFSLITAFLFGNVLSGIGGNGSGPKTGYLSVWLSFGIFAVLTLMFQKLTIKHSAHDFFSLTHQLFGKIGNQIFLVFVAIFSFSASFLSITNYMDFIQFSVTTNFPVTIGLFFMLLLTAYLCLKGIKIMGRYAEIILPIVIISVILLLTLGVKEIRNITLPLPSSPTQFAKQGWQIFCSPFSEITFLWILFDHLQNPEHIGKLSLKSGLITTILFSLVYLFNVNLLGENLLQKIRFPTYFSASLVEVGIVVENAESLITLSYSFCDILYGALCLFVGVKATCKLLETVGFSTHKTKKITAFSAVIFLFLLYISGLIPTDLSTYYPAVSLLFLPFTVGVPLLLFFLGKNQKSSSFSKKL